ncbi:unnamed protein product [Lupinus luteus]|uniref:Uncharacterized protein n=1 Tax=Lupinus luteus TaxID=3873 RepID=A0AAV1XTC8_LUPLU
MEKLKLAAESHVKQACRPPGGSLECPSMTPEMSSHEETENVGNSDSVASLTVDKPDAGGHSWLDIHPHHPVLT